MTCGRTRFKGTPEGILKPPIFSQSHDIVYHIRNVADVVQNGPREKRQNNQVEARFLVSSPLENIAVLRSLV